METGVQSSFIPPDTIEPVMHRRSGRGSLVDFLGLIAIVILVTSVALGAGVFLYNQYLETSKKNKLAQLERARAEFEPALIQELTRLDDRMNVAETLLANHIAPSFFFRLLELATLQTVSFKSLSFDVVDNKEIAIKMDGVAESVNSVALQADLFSKNGVITSPIFSDINRTDDGVGFNLTALVNPDAIRYRLMFSGAPAQEEAPQQEAQEEAPASPFQPSGPAQNTPASDLPGDFDPEL